MCVRISVCVRVCVCVRKRDSREGVGTSFYVFASEFVCLDVCVCVCERDNAWVCVSV